MERSTSWALNVRIVVVTCFRPDFQIVSELRVAIDPATEASPALSPLIDPNFHSCGTAPRTASTNWPIQEWLRFEEVRPSASAS